MDASFMTADAYRRLEEDSLLSNSHGSLDYVPRGKAHKAIALILLCVAVLGVYVCYDNPAALQNEIKSSLHLTNYDFSELYSWYAWPNILLPVVSGRVIDTVLGVRTAANIFAFIVILGQFCVAAGAYLGNYFVMEVGRFLFGIGGESLSVAQNTYASNWFSGDLLNFVFGMEVSVARLGSAVSFQTVGVAYTRLLSSNHDPILTLGLVFTLTGIFCVVSFFACLALAWLDLRTKECSQKTQKTCNEVNMRLPLRFWLLCLVSISYYVATFTFISLGQTFFMSKFEMKATEANIALGLPYLISAFASPFAGLLLDRMGRNLALVGAGLTCALVGYCLLTFTVYSPFVGMSLVGVAYSLLASALWPLVTLATPRSQWATAFGLMQAFQNAGLAVMTLAAGFVIDRLGFLWLQAVFIGCLVFSLVATLALWLSDFADTGVLNMSAEQRKAFHAATLTEEIEEQVTFSPREPLIKTSITDFTF